MRSGGLFAGYGGLDMAISEVFGAEPAWFSEIEDAPSKILAHHWPDVPNLGDITKIDWDEVEPVDILGGGFPCQDVSLAGKRAGMTATTRSGLWSYFAAGIEALCPQYVVIENVRGLLSAEAHSDVEPCPWCLGDGPGEPALRALGAVLGDLADLGYDAQWCGLRAADVGSPHGRYRIFVLAQDTSSIRSGSSWAHGGQPQRTDGPSGTSERPAADAGCVRGEPRRIAAPGEASSGWALSEPAGCDGVRVVADPEDDRQPSFIPSRHESELPWTKGGRAIVADSESERHGDAREACIGGLSTATLTGAASDSSSDGRHEGWPVPAGEFGRPDAAERGAGAAAWGQYGPAVERWERVLGRVAPAPTEPNAKGNQRLNPAFVEWMMGLPAGHVIDVPGVNRNAQLKALGNGVVPQQAIAALRHMYVISEGVSA